MRSGRLARVVLATAACLVPRWRRRSWREEWLAELDHAAHTGARRRRSASPLQMAVGALADAATLRMLSIRDVLSPQSFRRAWHGLGRDIALAFRSMMTAPALTLAIVASLGIGLAASTAGFSALQTLFFRPFPHVQNQQDLLRVCVFRGDTCIASFDEYERLREHLDTAESIAASLRTTVAARVGDTPFTTRAMVVSTNYFDVLGVEPAQGRFFTATDDDAGMTHPTAVISHELWQREFEGRPDTAGQLMSVNGTTVRLIGVAPRRFVGINPRSDGYVQGLWLPASVAEIALRDDAGQPQTASSMLPSFRLGLVARLGPGTSADHLEAQAASIAASFAPIAKPASAATAGPVASEVPGASVHPVFLNDPAHALPASVAFTGVPTIVLLIACVNAALLLVARATRRSGEWRVRMAIGATRWRLVRQLLVEATTLAVAGGALGLLLAVILLRLQEQLIPLPVAIDLPVLLFTVGAIACTAMLFGVGPAWSVANRASVAPGSLGRYRQRTGARSLLIAAQAALCVALLASGTQFIRALHQNLDAAGIANPDAMVVASVDLAPLAYPDDAIGHFYAELAARAPGLPGVARAGVSEVNYWNTGQEGTFVDVLLPGEPDSDRRVVTTSVVAGDLLPTLDLELLRGRWLAASGSPGSIVVNEAFERQVLNGNALGRTVRVRWMGAGARDETSAEIVGVVAPPPGTGRLDHETAPHVYHASARAGGAARWIYLRATDVAQAAAGLRGLVGTLDARVPVEVATLAERLRTSRIDEQWIARSTALLGLLGLMLTAGGLFGIVTFVVSLRTPEIGIRLALGASPRDVVRLIVRQAMTPVAVGLVAGSALAYGLGFVVQSRLYGSESLEPLALLAGAALLLVPTGLASLFPALRASRIDPNVALRTPD